MFSILAMSSRTSGDCSRSKYVKSSLDTILLSRSSVDESIRCFACCMLCCSARLALPASPIARSVSAAAASALSDSAFASRSAPLARAFAAVTCSLATTSSAARCAFFSRSAWASRLRRARASSSALKISIATCRLASSRSLASTARFNCSSSLSAAANRAVRWFTVNACSSSRSLTSASALSSASSAFTSSSSSSSSRWWRSRTSSF
mmetsp:Transcript_2614/g.10171  ORF Transcript_2614/g.10171 Transcript_2614/m.10171 type:complete len:208 (+) Transcript_2614:1354-1977(+)